MLLPLLCLWLTVALATPTPKGGGRGGQSAGGWRRSVSSPPRLAAGSRPDRTPFSAPQSGTPPSSRPKSNSVFNPPKFGIIDRNSPKHPGNSFFGPGGTYYDHSVSSGGQSGELNVSQVDESLHLWDFDSTPRCLFPSDYLIFFSTTETPEGITLAIQTQWNIHYPKELKKALKQDLQGVTIDSKTPREHWKNEKGQRWCGWYELYTVKKTGVTRGDIWVHNETSTEGHPVPLSHTDVHRATLEKIEAILLGKFPTVEIVLCVLFPVITFLGITGFCCVIKPIRKAKRNGRVLGGTPIGGAPLH